MTFLFLAFVLSANKKEEPVNYRDVIIGNWSVAKVDLTSEGRETDESEFFNVTMTNETVDGPLYGHYMDYEVEIKFTTRKSFDFSVKKDEKTVFEHSFDIIELERDARVCAGRIEELKSTFSLNILSLGVVEFSLFNTETKEITIYRITRLYEKRNSLMWIIPMIFPIVFLSYNLCFRKNPEPEGKQKTD